MSQCVDKGQAASSKPGEDKDVASSKDAAVADSTRLQCSAVSQAFATVLRSNKTSVRLWQLLHLAPRAEEQGIHAISNDVVSSALFETYEDTISISGRIVLLSLIHI